INIDAGFGEAGKDLLAVAAVGGKRRGQLAVIAKGKQRGLGHGVYREGRGERSNVEHIGCVTILGSGARPKQTLGPSAFVVDALPPRRVEKLAVCFVYALRDGDPQTIGQIGRNLTGDSRVPAAYEYRRDRADVWLEPRVDAPLDPAQERLSRRDILL